MTRIDQMIYRQLVRGIENKIEYCFAGEQTRSVEEFVFYLQLFYIMTIQRDSAKEENMTNIEEQIAHAKRTTREQNQGFANAERKNRK